jgi:L-lactate dehydrogenase complex protein LldG
MVEGTEPMSERERILGRIREALKGRAPLPGHHGEVVENFAGPERETFSQWLPAVGNTKKAKFEAFAKASADLKTDFRHVADEATMIRELRSVAKEEGWIKVASHHTDLTDMACGKLGLPTLWTDGGYDVNEMESCDVGISVCDALVAQTGTIVLTSRTGGGRALSVLPPHHVVLAHSKQMVRDLPAAFALLKERFGDGFPSMMTLITGPSRTGDIERILVLGAHGPKKLTVLCHD